MPPDDCAVSDERRFRAGPWRDTPLPRFPASDTQPTGRGRTGAGCPRTGFFVMARRPAIVSAGDMIPVVLACWGARFATGLWSRRRAGPRCRERCPEGAGEAGEGRGFGAVERRLGAG